MIMVWNMEYDINCNKTHMFTKSDLVAKTKIQEH